MSACLITSQGVFLHSHLSSHPPLFLFSSTFSTLIDFTLMFDSFFPSAFTLSSPSPFPPFSSACLSSCSGHQLFSFITDCLPRLFSPPLWTPKLVSAFPLRLPSQNTGAIRKMVMWGKHAGGCCYLLPINNSRGHVTASWHTWRWNICRLIKMAEFETAGSNVNRPKLHWETFQGIGLWFH